MKRENKIAAAFYMGMVIDLVGPVLSASAREMNVASGTGQSLAFELPDYGFILLIGTCIVGLAIMIHRVASRNPMVLHRKYLPDHGGRRSKEDRRQFSYTYFMPERRSGIERRVTSDRRLV